MSSIHLVCRSIVFAALFASQAAAADEPAQPDESQKNVEAASKAASPAQALDPVPTPPKPRIARDITQQAGTGGIQAYSRAGVLELGGSVGFMTSSNLLQIGINPSIGYFLVDNLELSAIMGMSFIRANDKTSTYLTLLAEPSYHLPFTDTFFGFVGLGAGLGYSGPSGAGFALAPRVGVNVLVGRSGIFTPAFQFIYTTSDTIQMPEGTAVVGDVSFGFRAGYTVMW